MTPVVVVSSILISAGVLFMAISALGLVRLPDVYSRAHAVAKSETFGLLLVFAGLLIRPEVDAPAAIRLALILVFALATNPTGVHALIRAGFRAGVRPRIRTDQAAADAALPAERREGDA